jgi:glyoxylate reductase
MKVFVTRAIPDEGIALLKEKGYEVEINSEDRVLSRDEIIEKAKGVDALLSLLTDDVDGELLDALGGQLKVVSNYAVGYDNIDTDAAKERGVAVTNTPGVLTESVAEYAFSLMLSIAKRIPEADTFTRKGEYEGWEPMLMLGTDVYEKTLGIVGLGRIGEAVARRAVEGFGMKVLYSDPNTNEEFEKQFNAEHRELEDLLKESDFVSVHVPLLPQTKHLIGTHELELMKDSAYLINTSRGPVIDEESLVHALTEKRIAGAALDVFENEPELAPGLADLDNVIITPHIASATKETRGKMSEIAAQNIIAILEGTDPVSRIV